jgi:hypothetical protein
LLLPFAVASTFVLLLSACIAFNLPFRICLLVRLLIARLLFALSCSAENGYFRIPLLESSSLVQTKI